MSTVLRWYSYLNSDENKVYISQPIRYVRAGSLYIYFYETIRQNR